MYGLQRKAMLASVMVLALAGCQTQSGGLGGAITGALSPQKQNAAAEQASPQRVLASSSGPFQVSAPAREMSFAVYIATSGGVKAKAARMAYGATAFLASFEAEGSDEIRIAGFTLDGEGNSRMVGELRMEGSPGFDASGDAAISADGATLFLLHRPHIEKRRDMVLTRVDMRTGAVKSSESLSKDKSKQRASCGLVLNGTGDRLAACTLELVYNFNGPMEYGRRFHPFDVSGNDAVPIKKDMYVRNFSDLATTSNGNSIKAALDGLSVELNTDDPRYYRVDMDGVFQSEGRMEILQTLHRLPDGRFVKMDRAGIMTLFDNVSASGYMGRLEDTAAKANLGLAGGSRIEPGASKDGTILPYFVPGKKTAGAVWVGENALFRVMYRNIEALTAGMHHGSNHLHIVEPDDITSAEITPQRIQAAKIAAEAYALWKNGFGPAGADKWLAAIQVDPILFANNGSPNLVWLFDRISNGDLQVPLADAGRVLLALMKALEPLPDGSRAGIGTRLDADGNPVLKGHDPKWPPSPLEEAGARDGDRIVSVDGVSLTGIPDPRGMLADHLEKLMPGTPVTYGLERAGQLLTIQAVTLPRDSGWQVPIRLFATNHFGLLAIQAGHPAIARQALAELRRYAGTHMRETQLLGPAGKFYPNLLEGLIVAKEQGATKGYDAILAAGGLGVDVSDVTANSAVWFKGAVAPLYADRAKLAYLTGKNEADLPQIEAAWMNPPPQPYPDMTGNIITPAGFAPVQSVAAPATPAPSIPVPNPPASTAPAPSADSGAGGTVLD